MTFRDNISVPSSRVKNPKRMLAVQLQSDTGKSAESGKSSVAWCQLLGLVGVIRREGECSSMCSFEERHFVQE